MLRKNLLSKKGIAVLALVLFFGAISLGAVNTAIAGPVCAGDFDTDGDVDGSDLAVFAGDFGRTNCESSDPYYTKAEVDTIVANLQSQIDTLKNLLDGVTRSGDDITFEGVNVHIVNGLGNTETVNGTGNLIVGYNEPRGTGDFRIGSHNIVVGRRHNYTSYGGLVVGDRNEISGSYSSVSGGGSNTASDYGSSVSGGIGNTAKGYFSSVTGGVENTASGSYSSVSAGRDNIASSNDSGVSGGSFNTASGVGSSVSGGEYNKASGDYSFVGGGGGTDPEFGNEAFSNYSAILGGLANIAGHNSDPDNHTIGKNATVSGGIYNTASGTYSSVSGGTRNIAGYWVSSVSGGADNTANEYYTSVSGGRYNIASGVYSSVTGGEYNTANGDSSSVSGGFNRTTSNQYDWVAGGLFQDQ